jgi:prenyltransferase beta subunit
MGPSDPRTVRRGCGALVLVLAVTLWLGGARAPRAQPTGSRAPAGGAVQADDFAAVRNRGGPEASRVHVTPETERAIAQGFEWLRQHQGPDGAFGSGAFRGNIAITSLAALALMASGSSPDRGPFGPEIDGALSYVMENTAASGFISVNAAATHGPMYSHGWGTLFLAEAYGMTHRNEIREKLQKAVRLIVDTQNHEGGWRYQPARNDADLSVTICQINALRAARNTGIFVPRETVEACIRYVKQSQNSDGGFRYMLQGGASEFPRSAAGVVALYSAAVYESEQVDRGIAYLRQFRPALRVTSSFSHYFYAHYYAAQAMWIRGGDDWDSWYPAIRDDLIRRQSPDGSWPDSVCPEYGTAMALIVLQMPNELIPIFQR